MVVIGSLWYWWCHSFGFFYSQSLPSRHVHRVSLRNQQPYKKPTRVCSSFPNPPENEGRSMLRSISFLSLRWWTTSKYQSRLWPYTIIGILYSWFNVHANIMSLSNTNRFLHNSIQNSVLMFPITERGVTGQRQQHLFSSLKLTNVATFCCPPQNAALQPWVRPGDVLIDKDNTLTVVYMRRQHLLQARITALGTLGHRATTLFWIFASEK
jgi:hypothetical protein